MLSYWCVSHRKRPETFVPHSKRSLGLPNRAYDLHATMHATLPILEATLCVKRRLSGSSALEGAHILLFALPSKGRWPPTVSRLLVEGCFIQRFFVAPQTRVLLLGRLAMGVFSRIASRCAVWSFKRNPVLLDGMTHKIIGGRLFLSSCRLWQPQNRPTCTAKCADTLLLLAYRVVSLSRCPLRRSLSRAEAMHDDEGKRVVSRVKSQGEVS